jgi:hypothetical protein
VNPRSTYVHVVDVGDLLERFHGLEAYARLHRRMVE